MLFYNAKQWHLFQTSIRSRDQAIAFEEKQKNNTTLDPWNLSMAPGKYKTFFDPIYTLFILNSHLIGCPCTSHPHYHKYFSLARGGGGGGGYSRNMVNGGARL